MATTPAITLEELPGGIVIFRDATADKTIQKDIVAGPCRLLHVSVFMTADASPTLIYLHLWNLADPTAATDKEHEQIELHAPSGNVISAYSEICNPPKGIKFDVGLSYGLAFEAGTVALATPPVADYILTLILKKGV